jgi:hypothetical protein
VGEQARKPSTNAYQFVAFSSLLDRRLTVGWALPTIDFTAGQCPPYSRFIAVARNCKKNRGKN